jgi:hypothetical protein
MSKENQSEWPRGRTRDGTSRNSPTGYFQTSNVIQKSDRSLAGPLRLGTSPGVGPSGALRDGSSDFGVDRITPRGFDPLGTSDTRSPAQEESGLVSREVRRGRRGE